MGDETKLTPGQKFAVRYMPDWVFVHQYPNGDVSVRVEKDKYFRFDRAGNLVERWTSNETTSWTPSYRPVQRSLSDDLTSEIKAKPIKAKNYYRPVSTKTVCQEKPECCQARNIEAVYWDADHTIWDLNGTAASVTGKLKKVDDNTVVELSQYGTSSKYRYEEEPPFGYELSETEEDLLVGLSDTEKDFLMKELEKEHGRVGHHGHKEKPKQKGESIRTTIKLDPTFRETLDELEKRGIKSSIISLNTPGSVKRILAAFGLADRFVEIRDSYEAKSKVFKELTHKQGICPCSGIFVDDARINTEPVAGACALSLQIGQGKDIQKDIEVLKYIKEPT